MKKKENYFNELGYDELKREVSSCLFRLNECANILKHFYFPVTDDSVRECLAVKLKQIEYKVDAPNAILDKSLIEIVGTKRYKEEVDNAPTLVAEYLKKVERAKSKATTEQEEQAAETNIKEFFYGMVRMIIDVRSRNRGIDAKAAKIVAKFLEVNSETAKVTLKPESDEAIRQEVTIVCQSKEAEKAMEAHEKAVQAINELLCYVRPDAMPDDFNDLFEYDGDKVVRAKVNYNLFIK